MTDPRLIVILGVLSWFLFPLGGLVACFGAVQPWAYPRNVFGVQETFVDWLGWLPGVDDGYLRVESALATLLVFGVGWGMIRVALALNPSM